MLLILPPPARRDSDATWPRAVSRRRRRAAAGLVVVGRVEVVAAAVAGLERGAVVHVPDPHRAVTGALVPPVQHRPVVATLLVHRHAIAQVGWE